MPAAFPPGITLRLQQTAKVVQMLKEKGIDKNDLSRKNFFATLLNERKYGNIIYNQVESWDAAWTGTD